LGDLHIRNSVLPKDHPKDQALWRLDFSSQQLTKVLLPYPAGAVTSVNGRSGFFLKRASNWGQCTWPAGTGGL
jgi:hypothetical protein